jgi:hypothetical protein
MIINDEKIRDWKQEVFDLVEGSIESFAGEAEENHDSPQYPVTQPRLV